MTPSSAAPVHLRRARPGDLAGLCRLERLCFPGQEAFSRRQYRALLASPTCSIWVLRAGGELVGSAVLLRRRRGRARMSGRLYSLSVAPAWQGRGLARRLLRQVVVGCRRARIDRLRLEVRRENAAAIALYLDEGFVVEARLEHYYGRRPGLRMRLDMATVG